MLFIVGNDFNFLDINLFKLKRRQPMTDKRGPRHSDKCPFYIVQDDPLSAKKSISRCVNCATGYNS